MEKDLVKACRLCLWYKRFWLLFLINALIGFLSIAIIIFIICWDFFEVLSNFLFTTSETIRECYLKRWYIRFLSQVDKELKTKLHRMIAQCPTNCNTPLHMETRTSTKYPATGCWLPKPMYRQLKHERPHRRFHPKTPTTLRLCKKVTQFLS